MLDRMRLTLVLALTVLLTGLPAVAQTDDGPPPERVEFASADGRTRLVGYVWEPARPRGQQAPGIVMMHGRAGAYSDRANGVYDASTLSQRHKAWGREWADAGYVALLVDGFGPRGFPAGFPRFSYDSRPAELNEVTVRPLDAYGGLAYLRSRGDVIADRIGLMGWSNGGSAAIVTISTDSPGITAPTARSGFRAALVLYPACGLKGTFEQRPFRPYAPTLVLHGSADAEVSYKRCQALVDDARANGGNVELKLYQGAQHSFDSPSRKRQAVDANARATDDAVPRALRFFARHVAGG